MPSASDVGRKSEAPSAECGCSTLDIRRITPAADPVRRITPSAHPPYVRLPVDRGVRLLRRHDLAWIDPSCAEVSCEDQAELQAWAARGLPLVVGRQDGNPEGVRMGFTVPGTGQRRRIGVRVSCAAILVHGAPPRLEDILVYAPPPWQAALARVVCALDEAGLTPRAYGSLVTQAFSGEACLRPDSDVDLLIDCDSREAALAALDVLACHSKGSPRLDGEIRMPGGRAVAWRELAQALTGGGQVLAKSNTDLQLMSPDDFLGAILPTGAVHASSRPLRAVPPG